MLGKTTHQISKVISFYLLTSMFYYPAISILLISVAYCTYLGITLKDLFTECSRRMIEGNLSAT